MHPLPFRGYLRAVASVVLLLAMPEAQARIIYSTPDSVYTQNFNTLTLSASQQPWTNNSTLAGWYGILQRPTDGALVGISAISASGGTSSPSAFTGSLFSYGGSLSTDRAFGATPFEGIGNVSVAVAFTNQFNNSLDSFTVTYDGEQWRRGNAGSAQSLSFSYGFGSSFANVSWVNVPSLSFTSPIVGATPGAALNGNAAANRTAGITSTITGLDWQVNQTLWLRWIDADNVGDEHMMGVDNFRFSATGAASAAVPEPSSMLLMSVVSIAGFGYRRLRRRSEGV